MVMPVCAFCQRSGLLPTFEDACLLYSGYRLG